MKDSIDILIVGGAILLAAGWLVWHHLQKRRKLKAQAAALGACGSSCDGCPFSKDCGSPS